MHRLQVAKPETVQGVAGPGIFLSLLFLGFNYLWFFIALIGIMDIVVKRQPTYSLVWWDVVFPCVTLTTAWLELSTAMDSPTFRVLTCMLTIFVASAFLTNLGFTLRMLVKGNLIFGQSQLQIEDGMMKRAMEEVKGNKEV